MVKKNEYFLIALEDLKEIKVFPFHLFIFNPKAKIFSPFLKGNQPLTNEKRHFLEFILSKGGKIAVQLNQQLTYLNHMGLKDSQVLPNIVNGLVPETKTSLQPERSPNETRSVASKQHLYQQLELVSGKDDFLPLILAVREEILEFSLRISPAVSLAVYFAEVLMQTDNFTNRVVTFSYLIARELNILDEKDLSDLICGAFLAHIGYTQLPLTVSQKPHLNFDVELKNTWKKHPGYSLHLIQKSRCLLTEQCLKIIDEHHERFDGLGFPKGIKDKHCHQLSLILGCSSHLFELVMGKIDGKKIILPEAISLITRKQKYAGLEFEYGDTIIQTLNILLNRIKSKQAA